jgi:hypothetical protein
MPQFKLSVLVSTQVLPHAVRSAAQIVPPPPEPFDAPPDPPLFPPDPPEVPSEEEQLAATTKMPASPNKPKRERIRNPLA